MPLKAITFDLDDTLWDVSNAIRKAEQDAFSYLCTHCPAIRQHQSIASIRTLMQQVLEQHPELTHQISTLRRKALARALRQSGYTQQQADLHAQAAFNVFLDTRHQVELFPYTVEVLHQLHQRYQLGALTNGNADIGRTAIGHYFDFSFSAEQLNNSKPHPALFHAALKYTGLSGSVCVHVGDHPTHDIQGAQQAGFFSVWVNRNSAAWPGGTPPSAEVSCLSELPEVIKQLA